MFKLNERITLVTGGASGIGLAIADTFSKAGATVIILDREAAKAEAVAESLRQLGGRVESLPLDVVDEQACAVVAETVVRRWGRIDILVNNAGIGHVGTMLETSGTDMDRLYAVNVRGIFNLIKAVLPNMLTRRSGNIINLASIGGIVGIRDRLAYCTTKFAVVGMTKSLALDHALAGIRVNCICPGRVETPFVSARLAEYPDPLKAREEMASTQALGRMGNPTEIAAAALYLASDESAFMTGTSFIIDGGWSAGK
ncbi:MAG: glucose 1-dehydrogenase [Pedosphaera sp.]|nr:glucose 1-dehydrogenase [Pedosphaera sp.]